MDQLINQKLGNILSDVFFFFFYLKINNNN